jgi:hypothetical protein
MGITIIILIVVALLSIGVKAHRMRRGGPFFWWNSKDDPADPAADFVAHERTQGHERRPRPLTRSDRIASRRSALSRSLRSSPVSCSRDACWEIGLRRAIVPVALGS